MISAIPIAAVFPEGPPREAPYIKTGQTGSDIPALI